MVLHSFFRKQITLLMLLSFKVYHFMFCSTPLYLGSFKQRIQAKETMRDHVRQRESAEPLNVTRYPACKVTPSKVDITINFTKANTQVLLLPIHFHLSESAHGDERWVLQAPFCLLYCYKLT